MLTKTNNAIKEIIDYLDVANGGEYFMGACGSDFTEGECDLQSNPVGECKGCSLAYFKWKRNKGTLKKIRESITMKNALKKYLILAAIFIVGLSGVANAAPVNIVEVLKAMPLVFMLHTAGHIEYGNVKGHSIVLDVSNWSEGFDNAPTARNTPRILETAAYITAGGFAYQEQLIKNGASPEIVAANAIYKAGYLLGSYRLVSSSTGDLNSMGYIKGHEAQTIMTGALILSTVSDALKLNGYMLNADISFIVFDTGAPGMMYTKRF